MTTSKPFSSQQVPIFRIPGLPAKLVTSDALADFAFQLAKNNVHLPIIKSRMEERRGGRSGRRPMLSLEATLAAFLILNLTGAPNSLTNIADVLYFQLSPKSRKLYGIRDTPSRRTSAK